MSSPFAQPLALPVGLVSIASRAVGGRLWWWLAVVSVVANAVVTGWLAWADDTPAFAFDEIHHLLMARMIAGFPAPDGSGAGYFPAWGILLAPLWWILRDPAQVYAAALAVGWLVGLVTIWPLARLVTRVRLSMAQSIAVAAVVSTLPARIVQADNVFSERLVFLLAVLAALAAFRLWERPGHLRAVIFALAVGALYFSHVRMLTVVLASAVWIVAFALRRPSVAVTGAVSLAASYVVFDRLGNLLDSLLRRSEMGRGESFLAHLTETTPGLIGRAFVGQLWQQTIGSFGLFAVGLVVVAVWCWREVRWRRLGRATWLAGALVASTAVSVLTWAQPDRMLPDHAVRLDAWLYGRYVDPLTSLVVALALAAVVRGLRTRTWAWSLGLAATVCLIAMLWVAPVAPTWGRVTPAHIGGLMPWSPLLPAEPHAIPLIPGPGNANAVWLWASLAALTCVAAFRLLRTRSWTAVILMLAVSLAGSAGVHAATEAYRAQFSRSWDAFEPLRTVVRDHGPLVIAYDYACNRADLDTGVGMNQYSFALLPNAEIIPYFRGEEPASDAALVLSCPDDEDLISAGAVPLAGFELYSSQAWVLPGALQDELAAEGMLESRQP